MLRMYICHSAGPCLSLRSSQHHPHLTKPLSLLRRPWPHAQPWQVASLRDLTNAVFYWKTPLTARYQGLNLTTIAESASEPLILPIFSGYQLGYEDVTAQLAPLPVPVGVLTPAQGVALGPLINGSAASA